MRIRTYNVTFPTIGLCFVLLLTNTAQAQVRRPQVQPLPKRPAIPVPVRPVKPLPPGGNGIILNKTDQLTAKDAMDRVRRTCHCKIYKVNMLANKRYVIDMTGGFDTYLRLEDAAGQQLAIDDDGGAGLNSRLSFIPKANGQYRVIATSCGGQQVGQFKLVVTLEKERKLALRKQGVLKATDPTDVIRQNCHFQIVTYKMEKGKIYTIDLEGNYDPYLRIEDALGNNRAQDDDGGVGLNSRLRFIPEKTDTYRIIITSCGSNRTGNYTLSVSE